MAPKAEKKPAQPAKKAVAKKSSAGRKKGSKKAVESYKIYIYKVCSMVVVPVATTIMRSGLAHGVKSTEMLNSNAEQSACALAGLEAGPPRHRYLLQGHVHPQLLYR